MGMIATAVCLAFIGYLFWTDVRKREARISWAPLVWMFLAGSRWVSSWLSLGGPLSSVDAYSEGSPVDRAVFFALIIWGVVVLARRNINWSRVLSRNTWIVLYLLYCFSSILWTDEAFILVKRWIKDLGNPIMALVIVTEAKPYEALGITLRRLAFLLLPLSVLFIRYYPELGRTYHTDGSPMYTGVGHQKNDLGLMCLMSGMYLFWKMLQPRDGREAAEKPDVLDYLLIAMLGWLLRMSDSQTSFACLVTSVVILLIARMKGISSKRSRMVAVLVLGALSYYMLDSAFHIKDSILALLGRDPSLTNRIELWDVVRAQGSNPIIGVGFMSFWAGERMQAIWDALGGGINQAHNGYLEQYLNLGYVGVAFIGILMVTALLKIRNTLDIDPAAGLIRLCFLVSAALYNYTEASFYGINNMWLAFLVSCLDVSAQPALASTAVAPAQRVDDPTVLPLRRPPPVNGAPLHATRRSPSTRFRRQV